MQHDDDDDWPFALTVHVAVREAPACSSSRMVRRLPAWAATCSAVLPSCT